jgi:AraC-like DNA-binding protein
MRGKSTAIADAAELEALVSAILVPLHVMASTRGRFDATVQAGNAGAVTIARLRSTPHRVARGPGVISSVDPELIKAVLQLEGTLLVSQDDRRDRVRPGELVILDTTRPYSLVAGGPCEVLVVGVPRALLGASVDLISRRTAVPVVPDSGPRAVIAAFLTDLADHIPDLPGAAGRHLGDGVASLLVAAFMDGCPPEPELGADLADRILAYAHANLADPGLSVTSVARDHGISPRQLHKLFLRRGYTFAAWVRRERLARVRRDLLDVALARHTTAAIAARWGMVDPSNLSRRLKAEFGQTAAEIRRCAK